ncbi:uncharacterized protein H6S33_006212 [Morchella sextelata]|uniref:uncharacterized protein n=1 Tax=Morchella sextelata TaxID=1174677 RepID=UPI001D05A174|nr:uncharacterized protein H6S33_006212 [Morchella sextelata]KAH0614326.1 hypothetical protein H6S33_006212 [Morchella sextelata]
MAAISAADSTRGTTSIPIVTGTLDAIGVGQNDSDLSFMSSFTLAKRARAREFNHVTAFRSRIREYNSALTFTSVKYTSDERIDRQAGGVTCFQIHGELYHLQGPLTAAANDTPAFAQLYFYDPLYAAQMMQQGHPTLDIAVLERLTQEIHTVNPFIPLYKTAKERLEAASSQDGDVRVLLNPQLRLIVESGADKRRHNLPTSNEVAAIIPDEYGEAGFRDIVLAHRNPDANRQFSIIDPNHAAYMPLHYVLLFPNGERGWHWGLRLRDELNRRKNLRLQQREFYRYRLHTRTTEPMTLFLSQRLFQQYLVDAWAVCDQNKLNWLRLNQANIRADLYNGLADNMWQEDFNSEQTGKRIILPRSYTGGDRYMLQLFQDSMAIVRHFGRPSLFVTFTANPKWEEITAELLPGQTAVDRPDLVARVFHLKQQQLLQEIKRKHIFGRYLGSVWTIEYQKRGLPHMHLLIFLHPDDRFLTAERIDEIVCAELPDPATDPTGELNAIIRSCMVHGPCGEANMRSPCMASKKNGGPTACSKRYPKAYQSETVVQEDGYPLYRRRNDGRTFSVVVRGSGFNQEYQMDNRWVVPYNPYLSLRYKAHINVEICGSIHAIKYIHKYIYKGSDRTTLQVGSDSDEITRYLQGRYIGPTEAVWRLFEYGMHEEYPSVIHLAVHLPGEQPVYYGDNSNREELIQRMQNSRTTLMAYFEYNTEHEDGTRYLYQDFPVYFTYDAKSRKWASRKKGVAIGRMWHCNPMMGEKYYMRLLLTVIPGAKSFDYLKTVNNVLYPTFKAACIALGLLDDDQEWVQCFTEASIFSSGYSLRTLFTTALLFGNVTEPLQLWDKFKSNICDDLPRAMERNTGLIIPPELPDAHLDYGLYLISQILADSNRTLNDFGLPLYIVDWNRTGGNEMIASELRYDMVAEAASLQLRIAQLNSDQLECFNTITHSIEEAASALFFIQGPAGTGKTFLYNVICNHFRSQGKIVLCVASSGIAAQLLPGGRTSHSRFKIPIAIHEGSTCDIKRGSLLAGLIQKTALIIWDEVPMQNKYCFEAVSRTLNDICSVGDDCLFGNIPVVLGGDFAQILPVVQRGNRAQIVQACLQRSSLWQHFKILRLKINMRVRNGVENEAFAAWLGQMSHDSRWYGRITLPPYIQSCKTIEDLCMHVFPQHIIESAPTNYTAFSKRAILAMRNDTVAEFNDRVLQQIQGEVHTYYSVDTVDSGNSEENANLLPPEYLQGLNPSGLPPSIIKLKVGAPIILLRNLFPKQGLCNGTRMTVTKLGVRCIEAKILGGEFDGEPKVIPRIQLSSTEGDLPFTLMRRQLPIRLCFAMTVNKSQGQSLDVVGVDLRSDPFTHGQLYVALSRVTDVAGLMVLQRDETPPQTDNIVYREVLLVERTYAGASWRTWGYMVEGGRRWISVWMVFGKEGKEGSVMVLDVGWGECKKLGDWVSNARMTYGNGGEDPGMEEIGEKDRVGYGKVGEIA